MTDDNIIPLATGIFHGSRQDFFLRIKNFYSLFNFYIFCYNCFYG